MRFIFLLAVLCRADATMEAEYGERLRRAQVLMHEEGLDSLLVTTPGSVHYFTGFHSPFFESPTRPWFVVVPVSGKPIAVVPSIGTAMFTKAYVQAVHTWAAPNESDDGVSLLAKVLRDVDHRSGAVGAEFGHEMTMRMPQRDLDALKARLSGADVQGAQRVLVDASGVLKRTRVVKTQQEIAKVAAACTGTSAMYRAMPRIVKPGMTEQQACRAIKRQLLLHVDDTNYVICRSGAVAYDDIIGHPTDRVLVAGDMFVVDTGSTVGGYFCDFNRNFAIGDKPDEAVEDAYRRIYDATDAALALARPGVTMDDLFTAMMTAMDSPLDSGSDVGRMGHSVGLQLTEWPSLMAGVAEPLQENMVITLEPSYPLASGIGYVVSEEVIRITADGYVLLSERAPLAVPVLTGEEFDRPEDRLFTLY